MPSTLPGKHTVFGKVTEGMEVLDKLESIGTQSGATKEKVIVEDCGEVKEAQ